MRRFLPVVGALCALASLCPHPAVAADANGNGLDDAFEEMLLKQYAPLVILSPDERALPANVDWFLARSRLDPAFEPLAGKDAAGKGSAGVSQVTQASLLGDVEAALRAVGREVARLRPNRSARPGSSDPRDWIVYGHVYPAKDGGVLVQYWFFYAFNDFYVLFDHDGDWEHVTLRLDARHRPLGVWYARHGWNAPGKWFPWDSLEREGEHPVVLSARGSHASYADTGDVLFWDRSCSTRLPQLAKERGCPIWRTWAEGTGGIVNTGPRSRPKPRAWFLSWPGQWGTLGWFLRETGGPPGPAYQAGWCSNGASGCS
ncbi:MAG TPA: Vps62-related protein [Anaeromyxobacteraceae bacterium]|nr:Vps62-related protein [Anaeromyxobacteraceae bacterium]